MGHDIYAYKVTQEEKDALLEKMAATNEAARSLGSMTITWNKFADQVYAGRFRRSAFDPLNAVIYSLLGAEDLYGGCSGIGECRTFELSTLQQALDASWYVGADAIPTTNTELAELVLHSLQNVTGADTTIEVGKQAIDYENIDLDEERQFLTSTIQWMKENDKQEIEIYFG